ncbi:MAG: hypothetical protein M0C28_33320 [Candidatus Moduliflexus flocculans]|nr:hypothetical protein [Candidatus Moduliflexus flocculans]
MRSVPYFNQLILFDPTSNLVLAGYPPGSSSQLTAQEEAGAAISAQGVPYQMYSIPPGETGDDARISFLAALPGAGRAHRPHRPADQPDHALAGGQPEQPAGRLNGAGMLVDDAGHHPLSPASRADHDPISRRHVTDRGGLLRGNRLERDPATGLLPTGPRSTPGPLC